MEKSMTEIKHCKRCGEDISHRHKNTKYCKWCAIQAKKEYQKKYIKQYMKQFPKSARGRYYQYYKFLLTLSNDELAALYSSKQHKCKEQDTDKRKIKAQMVLINEAYKRTGEE